MAAPIGNKFWQLRSKHGKEKLFASPELLWEAACEYFTWCVDNPLNEIDFRGKDAKKIVLPRMRAFTLQGLCQYLECDGSYLRKFKSELEKGNDPQKDNFTITIARIEDTIYRQKFEGAAAGFLNPNIIARDLGLADKSRVDIKVEQPLFGDDEPGEES